MSYASVLQKFFMSIGVDWVLYLLSALSVVSMGLILERWIFYRRRLVAPGDVRLLAQGRDTHSPKNAIEHCLAESVRTFAAEGMSRHDVENAADTELRRQRGRYEAGLTFLATLGNNTPFVGLLGTVLGIMTAFWQLSSVTDAARKNELLMSSISEALIATAMGLVVAIPAVAFYNVFRKRVNVAMEQAREIVTHRMHETFGNGANGHDDSAA